MKTRNAPRGTTLALATGIALVAACSRPAQPAPQVTCNPPALDLSRLPTLPAIPPCPPAPACSCTTIVVGGAATDAGRDAVSDAPADATDASADVVDAAADSGAVPADTTPVTDTQPTPPPQLPATTPAPPVVAVPATSLPGREVGAAIQARVNLGAAQRFCRVTAEQVRTAQRVAPDAPCASGEIGCWRRTGSARIPTCAASGDTPGCIGGDGTAWGCSGDAQRPNAVTFRCGSNVTCTTDGLATAAGVTPTR